MRTDLIHSKDRLVAIGGLAQEIQKSTNEEYIAEFERGEIDDILCLTWMCSSRGASPSPGVKNDTSSNPSWSWAYIIKTPQLTLEWYRGRIPILLIQLHDLKYEYATVNRLGDVKNATLRLRCKILGQALVSHQPHHELQHTVIMGGYKYLNVAVEWNLANDVRSDTQMITVHVLVVWSTGGGYLKKREDYSCNQLEYGRANIAGQGCTMRYLTTKVSQKHANSRASPNNTLICSLKSTLIELAKNTTLST